MSRGLCSSASLATVFAGAALALLLSTGIAVGAGALVTEYVNPKVQAYVAGAGFVVIGVWTIWQAAGS